MMTNALNRKEAPQFKQVEHIEFIKPVYSTLDNGIPLNYISGGSQEILKIDFIFNAGNWKEERPLVSAAANKLIKEGTNSYSAHAIAEGIDQYGAFLEVDNSFDASSVILYTLSKHLDKVLPIVKEVICAPSFEPEEFEIYKNNAMERFKVNLEKVSFVARKEFAHLIFGDQNPYGRNVTIEDYNNLTLEMVKDYYQKNYVLGNCRILVSGKVTPSDIAALNSQIGNIHLENVLGSTPNIIPCEVASKKLFLEKENALQSGIRIGKIMPNKLHPDYLGLQVFNTILGGYFGSRLMSNIREDKGYTYGIHSGIISLMNGGYFFISTEVGCAVTSAALTEIYNEIELLRTEEISEQELDLVRNYMLGQLLKSCDGAFNMAQLFESAHAYGLDYDFYNKYIRTIKEITPKTILELGVKYFDPSTMSEVVVGKI